MMRSFCVLFISSGRATARSSAFGYIVFPERFVARPQAVKRGTFCYVQRKCRDRLLRNVLGSGLFWPRL